MFSTVNVVGGVGYGASGAGTYAYSDAALATIINFAGGSRRLRWRFDLIRPASHAPLAYQGDITPYVTKAVMTYDTNRSVKRTLDLDMVETVASQTVQLQGGTITSAGINYLLDCVQPHALIGVPGTSNWIDFPCGLFRFSRPGVTVPGYAVVRTATMPDRCSIVQENAAVDTVSGGTPLPLTLPGGEYVIDVITRLLTNSPTQTPPYTLATLPGCALGDYMPANAVGGLAGNTPGDWPTSATYDAKIPSTGYPVNEGESYLDLINRLAYTIGLNQLMSDERGIFRLYPWTVRAPSYTIPAAQYTYDTTSNSIVQMGLSEEIEVDDVANVVEVIVEDVNRQTARAVATNNDSSSPYYYGNLGRRVVKTVRDAQVPDATSTNFLQNYAKDQLLRASWLTDKVTLPIAVNPLHCGGPDYDVVALNIYQSHVEAGVGVNNPVIVGFSLPGLVATEKFIVDGWTITAQLATPGSASSLTGNVGLSTVLEPRESKTGSVMVLTAHRITSTVSPSLVTVTS